MPDKVTQFLVHLERPCGERRVSRGSALCNHGAPENTAPLSTPVFFDLQRPKFAGRPQVFEGRLHTPTPYDR